jgi:hypothetical protein
MIKIYASFEELPERRSGLAIAHHKAFEDALDVQFVPDDTVDIEYGVYGDVYAMRNADTDALTSLSIHRASSIITDAKVNKFHILCDLIPDQTITELALVCDTHREGYAIISYPVVL